MARAQVSHSDTLHTETAVDRRSEEVKIVGRGTLAPSGLPFVLVSSASEPGRVHVVSYCYEGAYVGARIHCDCIAAARYGRQCKHVRLVLSWLVEQMLSAPLPPPPSAPARPDARETAILRRSQKPFSVMK